MLTSDFIGLATARNVSAASKFVRDRRDESGIWSSNTKHSGILKSSLMMIRAARPFIVAQTGACRCHDPLGALVQTQKLTAPNQQCC